MFSDRAKIHVAAGRGGNGCTSFRREKHVPRGGPDGGDGGPGGEVYLVADPQLRDLSAFVRRVHFKASSGRHGQGANKDGAGGDDLEIPVPLGTVVHRDGVLLADLTLPGQRAVVAAGGRGGRGNARFVTSTRQAPHFSERGDEGEGHWIELTLRLMADVGLAGLPNAGKSSLLRRLSNARPKVADYPFTTVEPLLGVVEVPDDDVVFTVADVPGLLEGASDGVGLGHEFLAHLERCHLLLHVVDVAGYYGADPADNFRTILGELDAHAHRLGSTPQVVVLNKVDTLDGRARNAVRRVFEDLVDGLREERHPAFCWEVAGEMPPAQRVVWEVSAVTGEGLVPLVRWVGSLVSARRAADVAGLERGEGVSEVALSPYGAEDTSAASLSPLPFGVGAASSASPTHMVYRPIGVEQQTFEVRREEDHFVVEGEAVERLVRRFDLENDQAVRYLGERLDRMGLTAALREAGATSGDEVYVAGHVFEFE